MNRQEFKEYTLRTGAVLTAAGAAFLGRVGVMPAIAATESSSSPTAEQIDHRAPQLGPEGVPALQNQEEEYQEASKAFSQIKERVNGVLWLHAPKKNALVGFKASPTAYTDNVGPEFAHGNPGALRVTQYYIVDFKTKAGMREYAVTFDQDQQKYSFLDLEYAQSMGAVSFGQFKGLSKESPFNVSKDAQFTPINDEWSTTPPAVAFKSAYDIHGKLRQVVPSPMPR